MQSAAFAPTALARAVDAISAYAQTAIKALARGAEGLVLRQEIDTRLGPAA